VLQNQEENYINSYRMTVPEHRKERIMRYKQLKDRAMALAAEVALQEGLRQFGLDSEKTQLICNEHGKPMLKDYPDLQIGISHSGGLAAVVFADCPAGIDVEHICDRKFHSVLRLLAKREQQFILEGNTYEEQCSRFLHLWTYKESYYKCIGTGLVRPLSEVEMIPELTKEITKDAQTYIFQPIQTQPSYYVTVCLEKR
jgi:4'-phosphopantetheinyl transferase